MSAETDALGFSQNNSMADIQSAITDLQNRVAQVQAQLSVGNPVYGSSSIQTALSSEVYTVGPFRMDCDVGFPNTFDLWVPANIRKIIKVNLRVKLRAIRLSVGVAAASGTLTSNSGGASTSGAGGGQTSSAGGAQTSSSGGATTSSTGGVTGTNAGGAGTGTSTTIGGGTVTGTPSATTTVAPATHTHQHSTFIGAGGGGGTLQHLSSFDSAGGVIGSFDLTINSGSGTWYTANFAQTPTSVPTSNHTHTIADHTHTILDHTHPITDHTHTIGNHTHTVVDHTHMVVDHTHTTPNHTHTVPTHTHTITTTISEGGSPAGVRFTLDTIDRSAALGGPWNADFGPVEITTYLLDSVGRPVTGAHAVSLSTTQAGALEASLDFYVIAQPV